MINRNIENQIFFSKYKVEKLINKSEFSCVYKGINIISKESIAIKIENRSAMNNILESEAYILFMLKGIGIPNFISYGKNIKYNILVEELLGLSLNDISKLKKIKNRFPIKDICMIAIQGLDRLEFIHSKNIIHRDIKPHNFLIGRKDEKIIYLIDFGFAKKYKSSRTGKFIKFSNLRKLFGSMAFSSINANSGYEQSRRDDLESLGYMLIFLAKNNLPWMNIGIMKNKKEEANEICKLKKRTEIENLCEGLPEEFRDYINYCRKLEFEQDPNYKYLRYLFSLVLTKNNQKNDLHFFWINKKNSKSPTKSYENYHIMRRDTHKRLYNSVKKSLEKKRRESNNNTLKSNYLKDNDSLEKINDLQNNKKDTQKKNYIFRNIDKKSSYNKNKISIINLNTDNNINQRTITTSRIDEQKYNFNELNLNQFISKNDSSYYSKNKSKLIRVNPQKTLSDYIGPINNPNASNQNINGTMNITIKNYYNFENSINNYQTGKTINNNSYNNIYYNKNNYCNKIVKEIPFNNYNYKMIPEIHYKLKYKILGTADNKNKFKNNNNYSFQNDEKNIRTQDYKNIIVDNNVYSFQNKKKNISFK